MMSSRRRFEPIVALSGIALISIGIFFLNAPQIGDFQSCLTSTTFASNSTSPLTSDNDGWLELELKKPVRPSRLKNLEEYARPSIPEISLGFAYVTFLQDHYLHDDKIEDSADEYFISTRVLGYQLMHSPKTATKENIPFVVVCTQRVRESKKKQLEDDGATIVTVEFIENPEWMDRAGISERWATVITKMRIFQLTQFEKILLLDSDIFVVEPLDAIFQDPSTSLFNTDSEMIATEDEGKVPKQYMMAGQGQQRDWVHPYPPDPDEQMYGAGFFLTTPSNELFDYYMHVLYCPEGRFDPVFPEQNLMNYAHRRDGPMPWKDVDYKWTTTFPTMAEYEAGAKSLHHKWWWSSTDIPEHGLNQLTTKWFQVRGEMEGYYNGLEEGRNA